MESLTKIGFLRLERGGRKAPAPRFATAGSAAADLTAFLDGPVTIHPGERAAIPTGIALQLPAHFCACIMARSGLALKSGICLANGVGLIDSDYRGELLVALQNNSDTGFTVTDGMRIAQLLCLPVPAIQFIEQTALDDTDRGAGGFGSTGLEKMSHNS